MTSVTAIVPTLDAGRVLEECLQSIVALAPAEVLVVDGGSRDETRTIAARFGVTVIDDDRQGVSAARQIGVEAATSDFVLLIDADVILPCVPLAELVDELIHRELDGLQLALRNVSMGQGYWGHALASHSQVRSSGSWSSFSAALFRRSILVMYPFDPQMRSGEDLELRERLKRGGVRIGISGAPPAVHRYDDAFGHAVEQWLADGRGLANVLWKSRWRSLWVVGVPLAAFVRGVVASLMRRSPSLLPYYGLLLVFNYAGFVQEMARKLRAR